MPSPRSRRTTLTPSRPGIITSSTITAGGRCATAARASRPSAAVVTAKPSRRSARSRACLTVASSSTTRTSGSLRTTPPMMRPRPDDVLHLGLGDAELGGQLGDEGVALGLVLLVEIAADLLQRGAQLGLGDAELLGDLRDGRTDAAADVVTEAGAAEAPAGSQVVEGRAELVLADAELLREVGEGGLAGAAIGAGLQRVERGADLGRVDAELGREGIVEALEPVAAPLTTDALRSPWNFSSAAVTFAASRPSSEARALASASWCSSFFAPRSGRRSSSAARSLASVTPSRSAMPERSRGPPGPRPDGAGDADGGRGRAAAAERRAAARLGPERVGPGGEHERAAERDGRLLCTWGHGRELRRGT